MDRWYVTRIFLVLAMGGVCLAARAQDVSPTLSERLDIETHGFMDVRAGTRVRSDPYEGDTSLAEARLQLEMSRSGDTTMLMLRADFLYDHVVGSSTPDLQEGTGWIDLREANILWSPYMWTDIKFGRQILTWGTGDLVFINDLFPKDWQSFFTGRDEEYLKAPSDALLVSLYPEFVTIDLVYTPRFDSDRYISGERLSYWNPMLGERAGQNAVIDADKPDEIFEDDEFTLRLYRTLRGIELALYGYTGFWKSPMGFDPISGQATFPALNVYGASARGQAAGGVYNAEVGYYDSRDDRSGADPFLPNSEARGLVGYERELMTDLMLGLQYYLEVLQDYDGYLTSLPEGSPARDEYRHLLTARLTQMLLNQNLTLSLFTYYSPSDQDGYLRPIVKYKLTDEWLLVGGGNLFFGKEDYTFFGQFDKNNNIYAGLRYSF